jgi:MFS family permease
VGLSDDYYGKLMSFYFLLSLLLALPLGWMADRFHPLRLAMVALLLHGAASLWGGMYIHNGQTFAIAFVLTGMLSGV